MSVNPEDDTVPTTRPETLPEMGRALWFVERRVDVVCKAVCGDPANRNDTGLKGEVQMMRAEQATMRALLVATLVLVSLCLVPIAIRAFDATGRDWGLWAPPMRAQAP